MSKTILARAARRCVWIAGLVLTVSSTTPAGAQTWQEILGPVRHQAYEQRTNDGLNQLGRLDDTLAQQVRNRRELARNSAAYRDIQQRIGKLHDDRRGVIDTYYPIAIGYLEQARDIQTDPARRATMQAAIDQRRAHYQRDLNTSNARRQADLSDPPDVTIGFEIVGVWRSRANGSEVTFTREGDGFVGRLTKQSRLSQSHHWSMNEVAFEVRGTRTIDAYEGRQKIRFPDENAFEWHNVRLEIVNRTTLKVNGRSLVWVRAN